MASARRSALRLLGAVVLAAAGSARAGVTGNFELQGNTTQNLSPGVDRSPSSFLMESLSLHYAGLPFGPAVAVVTAGGAFSNVDGWMGTGARTQGRVLSFDTSVGFLPRRAVPLRLYASGAVDAGTAGVLASAGAGPSLVYGAAVNLEPGRLPGLRLDASESRASRVGFPDLSDVRRTLVASSYGDLAGQRVNLGVRLESDHREGYGDLTTRGANLSISSPAHQTSLAASDVRRTIPNLSGITDDWNAVATSNQRWKPTLTTQLGLRVAEAGAGVATGTLGDARAGVTWVALPGVNQLTLSAGGSAGLTRTTSSPGAPPASGDSWGANGRVSYDRALGRFTGGLALGGSTDTCNCAFGNDGTVALGEATVSLGLPSYVHGSGQASYTVVLARAPLSRGGDRVDHRARAYGRVNAGPATVSATLGVDDGTRELLDISTGRASTLEERSVTGSLGVASGVRGVGLNADVRYTRGRVVTESSPFISGGVRQAREITSGQAGASWRPLRDLTLRAQAIGTWTVLDDTTTIGSFGVDASLGWRLDRFTLSVQYQALRADLYRAESSFLQSIRTTLSRPFEL